MKIEKLRYEIAHKRFELYQRALVHYHETDQLFSHSPIYDQLSLRSALQHARTHPTVEHINLEAEITEDLLNLERIMNVGYDSPIGGYYLPGRKFSVEIEGRSIDCAALAAHGILTPSLFQRVRSERTHYTQEHYTLKEVASELGVHVNSLVTQCDKEQMTLYGRINIHPAKSFVRSTISGEDMQILMGEADNAIFVAEVAALFGKQYGYTPKDMKKRLNRFFDQKITIDKDDPFANYSIIPRNTFGRKKIISLKDLDVLANVFRRDARIRDTHLTTEQAAAVLDIKHGSTVSAFERDGVIRGTQMTFLALEEGKKTAHFFSSHSIEAYKARRRPRKSPLQEPVDEPVSLDHVGNVMYV